jgi:hypothetical protein
VGRVQLPPIVAGIGGLVKAQMADRAKEMRQIGRRRGLGRAGLAMVRDAQPKLRKGIDGIGCHRSQRAF